MTVNEAHFSMTGFVASQPRGGKTKYGTQFLNLRAGWTPRRLNASTGEWNDEPTSFVSVRCYRKVAEHGYVCLRKGDPIVLRGTVRIREYTDPNGVKHNAPEVVADFIGHDLSRGISTFTRRSAQVERTASEYDAEQDTAEQEAAGQPLPGDQPAFGLGPVDPGDLELPDFGDDDQPDDDRDGEPGFEPAVAGSFDEEGARRLLDTSGEASDPVGAAS